MDLKDFYEYLIQRAPASAREYIRQIKKPLHNSKNSIVAHRLLIHYAYEKGIVDLRYLLKYLKIPRSNIDFRIPNESEVLDSFRRINRNDIKAVYSLLISGGIRVIEAIRLLRDYDESLLIRKDGFMLYPLSKMNRGNKRVYYAFILNELLSSIKRMQMTPSTVTNYCERKDIIRGKYIRKFVATKMFELGIPSEIIDFIQGRTPESILVRHYLKLLPLAIKEYRKYAEWLSKYIIHNNYIKHNIY
ncbi:MAG: hypothetical protein B6U95_00575 [Thermofilum sp. ex4484_82]|nr:MAG: hypothetical protein B6U95_00575 [Thermofilum sp. ex4484_82]OYT39906.1 MAG: hypothetical protein B6U96_00580 [Archaeoglobales archaeon ex4484_92]